MLLPILSTFHCIYYRHFLYLGMLSSNLKYLRQEKNISQQELAETLKIPRTTLGDYERAKTEPNIVTIIKLSQFFKVDLDNFLKQDLTKNKLRIENTKAFKVLAISVDGNNRENIELVKTKATAGYLNSFSDPEYIGGLPKLYIPGLEHGTFRAFQINGNSMLPLESDSIVICSYVEELKHVKDDATYVVVSQNEGVVYKRLKNNKKEKELQLISDNAAFLPYTISYSEVQELWKFHAYISFSDKKHLEQNNLQFKVDDMQGKINQIYQRLQ